MRYLGLASLAGVFVLASCGGGAADNATPSGGAPAAAPAAAAPAETATPIAVTGKVHEMDMVQTGDKYEYKPAKLTIKVGDGVKFIASSGFPHNVAFDPAGIPAGTTAQLTANMEKHDAPLTGPYFLTKGEAFTVSFAGLPPGLYKLWCTPHLPYNMRAEITVE